jgi:hypothetical protein
MRLQRVEKRVVVLAPSWPEDLSAVGGAKDFIPAIFDDLQLGLKKRNLFGQGCGLTFRVGEQSPLFKTCVCFW